MYELFLTAVVPGKDVDKARAVLGGVAGWSGNDGRHTFNRVVYFHKAEHQDGVGLPTIKTLSEDPKNGQLWKEIDKIVSKQSYVLKIVYPVDEQSIQNGSASASLAGQTGFLRFYDVPDALPNRAALHHHQCQVLEITQPDLDGILLENQYIRKNEVLEESYVWVINDCEYTLQASRLLGLEVLPADAKSLPHLSTLPMLSDNRILYVRTYVREPNPDTMAAAVGRLDAERNTFTGVFDFRAFDRLIYDTRARRKEV